TAPGKSLRTSIMRMSRGGDRRASCSPKTRRGAKRTRHGRGVIIQAPARCGRARRWNAADGRRCKIVGAFLLQVTPDLPNPAEYEADRHRDRDFENHHQ